MLLVFLALVASTPEPPVLGPQAACRLASADRILAGKIYSVRGTYQADGMHGSYLEVPKCKMSFSDPQLVGDAARAADAYHEAFRVECRGVLFGDYIRGVFTGTFVKRRSKYLGRPIVLEVFQISHVTTKDLDASSITCGTK
jgi:hypothetical protein